MWSGHTGEWSPVPEMELLPLHHSPLLWIESPADFAIYMRFLHNSISHFLLLGFIHGAPASCVFFFTAPCCTTSDQSAKKLVRQNKAYCLQEKLGTRKHKYLETITQDEIFFWVSRNLSGKEIDLFFNILTWLTQKTENHLKLFCLCDFYYL